MAYVIHSIEGNRQRLDGGSMFGNVPRALWSRWIEPDERHRIELACRAFLVHDTDRDRRILLEAGIGVFFEPKLRDRFGVSEPDHRLLANLAVLGVAPQQIDVVLLSHLHFDHAGGLLTSFAEGEDPELVFPNASYVTGRTHYARARDPHFRDRASFIPPLLDLLDASGRLELVTDDAEGCDLLGPDFSFHRSDGHTPGLLLGELNGPTSSAVFCGDLIPGAPWIHLPVTMGYDRFPERLIEEKRALLERCLQRETWLLLTHDAGCAACRVGQDDKGRFGPVDPCAELCGLEL